MLVVEDDAETRTAVVAMLEELGVTDIETANDGEQALEALRVRKFGTILLDLMMPRVDGYEVLRALRSGTHLRPDKVIVMSDAVIQQIGTSRDVHEHPRTRFVAQFIGNNNIFKGTIKSRSGAMVFVESENGLFYVRIPEHMRQVPIGGETHFSVRADLLHTGEQRDMANRIEGSYITTEYMGTLETDVFEVAPGLFVHVEQHRHANDHIYAMGDREVICWPAEAGVLLG